MKTILCKLEEKGEKKMTVMVEEGKKREERSGDGKKYVIRGVW